MSITCSIRSVTVTPPPPEPCPDGAQEVAVASGGAVGGSEQGLALGAELGLVEMTEVEYTQLQHLIYEVQVAEQDGPGEAGLPPDVYTTSQPAQQTGYQSPHPHGQIEYVSDSSPPTPECAAPARQHDPCDAPGWSATADPGPAHFQQLKMIVMSDPSSAERTPAGRGQVAGSVFARVRNATETEREIRGEAGESRRAVPDTRAPPAARVRLERRFNSSPSPLSRAPDCQSSSGAMNNFLSMLHHPSELPGVSMQSQQNKYLRMGRSKSALSAVPLEFAHPLYGASLCSSSGNISSSQAQTVGTIAQMLESTNPRNCTFHYQQERDSSKPAVLQPIKSVVEQVWVKVEEDTLQKNILNKRSRTGGRQVGTERPALKDIQNIPRAQSSRAPAGTHRKGSGEEENLRREKHNSMERDRRRRIRICCDELNLLVPFCTPETDKATTLQWTTAFLKYIHEIDGDRLKTEFESVFCGKTGKRMKLAKAEQFVAHGEARDPPNTALLEQK
ncbi:transcription factor-like 5 protein [Amia ocellicauda]|uniref:transcription factor-like 5 protein n=1 Tax=Amia ocellicauda TaxID=2972642 RepID=UPI003464A09E